MKCSFVVLALTLATLTSALPYPGEQNVQAGSPGSSWGGHGGDHGGYYGPGGWGPSQQKRQQQGQQQQQDQHDTYEGLPNKASTSSDETTWATTKAKRGSPAPGDSWSEGKGGAYKEQSMGKESGFWGPAR